MRRFIARCSRDIARSRFLRAVEGASTVVTVVVLAITVTQLYLGAFVDHANAFGFGPSTGIILGTTSAALTLIAHALPSIFETQPPSGS